MTFTTASQQVKENAGTATIGVELSAVSGRDVTVPLMVSGTAKTPGNYTMTPGPVVIKAGRAERGDHGAGVGQRIERGRQDGGGEHGGADARGPGEDDHEHGDHREYGSRARGIVCEREFERRGEVRPGASGGEALCAEREAGDGGVRGEGRDGGPGKDYALPGGVLSFEPGETSKTLVVDIKNHGIYDDDKTLELALKNPKNAVLGSTAVHTHTIIISGESEQTTGVFPAFQRAKEDRGDSDQEGGHAAHNACHGRYARETPPSCRDCSRPTNGERRVGIPKPTVAFLYASSRGYEKVSTVRVPVALSAGSGKPVTVEYAVTGGTAVRGMNYTLKRREPDIQTRRDGQDHRDRHKG